MPRAALVEVDGKVAYQRPEIGQTSPGRAPVSAAHLKPLDETMLSIEEAVETSLGRRRRVDITQIVYKIQHACAACLCA